jgi:hypothetical protein
MQGVITSEYALTRAACTLQVPSTSTLQASQHSAGNAARESIEQKRCPTKRSAGSSSSRGQRLLLRFCAGRAELPCWASTTSLASGLPRVYC